ncbi:MAG: Na(+)-translocating NADH-quinone reductase subunit A [Muribaculaceae bacterium]
MTTIKLTKGYNLKLKGNIEDFTIAQAPQSKCFAVVPDDFTGVVPRLEKKEGDTVAAGEAIYHDKSHEAIKVCSPVSGTVKEVRRGERRKIEAIIIEADGKQTSAQIPTTDVKSAMLQSGLWAMLRQRPYDIVPNPDVEPRDIFVTCFDSAPLAPSLSIFTQNNQALIKKGVEALAKLTSGKVYLGCAPDNVIDSENTAVFHGPHPAGNAGIQAANINPVNKGEVIWTTDIVTVIRLGQLLTSGTVDYNTIVAVTGENVKKPQLVKCLMGAPISDLVGSNITDTANTRIISGNVLTGTPVEADGYLRAPYRQITAIPNISRPDEFMGWASISPKKFSIYRSFTSWLLGKNKPKSFDAKINGGERAIVMAGEYDRMIPMDIYAEFLIKAIITFDIEKMEQLGIYEVAPEDFALAEYADTSKLELQRIVRDGLNRLHAEMC